MNPQSLPRYMDKGGRLTTSRRSERLLSYNYGHGQGSTITESSELGEDDVWSTVDDAVDREDNLTVNDSTRERISRASGETNGSYSRRSRRQVVPQDNRHVGGLWLAFEDSGMTPTTQPRIVDRFHGRESVASSRGRHMATSASAPVNVPDWSRILRVDSVESLHEFDDRSDDFEFEMVPPHEYLARSRKMGATSVFEGVGRTLKGRDLSRVRDAVWSQTGFDG